jgi:hypothetical protein
MPVTVGAATNVNWSFVPAVLEPPAEVTEMSTVPAPDDGETAEMDVSPFTVKVAAGNVPKLTADAPVNASPVIVTVVPPAAGPAATDMPVIRGRAT